MRFHRLVVGVAICLGCRTNVEPSPLQAVLRSYETAVTLQTSLSEISRAIPEATKRESLGVEVPLREAPGGFTTLLVRYPNRMRPAKYVLPDAFWLDSDSVSASVASQHAIQVVSDAFGGAPVQRCLRPNSSEAQRLLVWTSRRGERAILMFSTYSDSHPPGIRRVTRLVLAPRGSRDGRFLYSKSVDHPCP